MGKLGRFFLLVLILPVYKVYLSIKKLFNKFYAPKFSKHRIIHPFSRRYLVHIILIVLGAFTVTSNINAYETNREDFGQTSIMARLVTTQDLGVLEEEGPVMNTSRITRYLGQTGVENKPYVLEGGDSDEILPSTTSGGSALIKPILSPVEEELRDRDEVVIYTVQPGDTASEISEKFGITTNTLLWENNLSSYTLIRPGDKLTILPSSGIRHKVASGETINSIANKYNVEAEKIIENNKLASADDINIGETLMIPGGRKIVPKPVITSYTVVTKPTAPVNTSPVTATGEMQWPSSCRRITQYFGWRHSGLDVACGYGKNIYAADSGTVIKAQGGYNGGYGIYIIIDHGNGKQSLYGHLSKLYVQAGESVTKGDIIAAEGSTGRSTGAHVHFEIRVGGDRKNPLYYIE